MSKEYSRLPYNGRALTWDPIYLRLSSKYPYLAGITLKGADLSTRGGGGGAGGLTNGGVGPAHVASQNVYDNFFCDQPPTPIP